MTKDCCVKSFKYGIIAREEKRHDKTIEQLKEEWDEALKYWKEEWVIAHAEQLAHYEACEFARLTYDE